MPSNILLPEMPSNILLLMKSNVGQWMSYWYENRFTDKTLQVVFVSLRTAGTTLTQVATALKGGG